MRRLLIHLSLFLLFPSAIIVLLFGIPADKKFAYHFIKTDCYNHSDWIYGRMLDTASIDIAFIGSSRTIHAIADSLIESLMGNAVKESPHIVNLGYCRFGRNLDFVIVKDLLAAKRVRMLVLEVREDEDPFSHLDFGYIASSRDLLQPVFINARYFNDFWKGLQMRVEWAKSGLKVRPVENASQRIPSSIYGYGTSGISLPANETIPSSLPESTTAVSFWREIKMNFPRYYLAEIATLAKANDARFFFLYIPSYGFSQRMPREYLYYRQFGQVLIPPAIIFSNPAYFMDENHLNDQGSAQMAEWLVQSVILN